jgi:hypothetical protein
MKRLAIGLLLSGCLGAAAPGWAQAPGGWYVTPSLGISAEFDDNVFVTAGDKQADFITRFTPGLELGYRSEPFTLLLGASFDAEIYAKNTELSDEAVRKRAALRLKYLPYRLLTLGLDVTYLDTQTPTELVPTTGLQLARRQATELIVTPAATYQLTAVDTLRGSYSFIRDTLDEGLTNHVHRVRLGYARQLTPLDTGLANYRLGVYQTEDSDTAISNTVAIGWVRQLTPTTFLTLEAGPRFVDNEPVPDSASVRPDAHARIEHAFPRVKLALDYLRSESFVVGLPGIVETETISGLVEVQPLRELTMRFEPAYIRTFDGLFEDTQVLGFLLSAYYTIKPWLTARLAYRFAYQKQGGPDLTHNVVTLGLDFGYPIRVADWVR